MCGCQWSPRTTWPIKKTCRQVPPGISRYKELVYQTPQDQSDVAYSPPFLFLFPSKYQNPLNEILLLHLLLDLATYRHHLPSGQNRVHNFDRTCNYQTHGYRYNILVLLKLIFVKLPAQSKTGSRHYFHPVTTTTITTTTRTRTTSPNF